MREIVIKIGQTELNIIGTYFESEDEVGLPARFEIFHIEPITKDIYDLLEYFTSLPGKRDYLDIIEELVLEDISMNG